MNARRASGIVVTAFALAACGSAPVAVRPVATGAPAAVSATTPPAPSAPPSPRASRKATLRATPRVTPTALPTTPPPAAPTRPTVATPPAEIALPTHEGATPHAGLGAHTLLGNRKLGCVWIVQGTRRYAAVWPPGFRARFDPVRIYDAEHRLVWREGQVMELGGGPGPQADRVPPRCRVGEFAVWVMDDFEPVV
jgi:hypothetical protein